MAFQSGESGVLQAQLWPAAKGSRSHGGLSQPRGGLSLQWLALAAAGGLSQQQLSLAAAGADSRSNGGADLLRSVQQNRINRSRSSGQLSSLSLPGYRLGITGYRLEYRLGTA